MASKLAEKAPGWFNRILMPELVEIKRELKNINTTIDSLDSKIDSVRNELKADISRVESKVEADLARVESKVEELDKTHVKNRFCSQ
jgi:peptidoglycan hydrolase CwlO-like protein